MDVGAFSPGKNAVVPHTFTLHILAFHNYRAIPLEDTYAIQGYRYTTSRMGTGWLYAKVVRAQLSRNILN